MQIRIGVIGNCGGWELLLRQEGIPFARLPEREQIDSCSAVVAGDKLTKKELSNILSYLRTGGGVLCSARVFSELGSFQTHERFLRHLLPDPESKFAAAGLIDVFTSCVILNDTTSAPHGDNFPVVEREYSGGFIVVLPFDADKLILDDRQISKSFYARNARLPFERVSLVSRRGLRVLVSRALELLHHRRGIPFAHLWYFPRDARSVFCFRIDTDYGTTSDIESLYALSCEWKIPFTWFLDLRSQERLLPLYKKMERQEVGVHCYDHKRYASESEGVEDITRALGILQRAGLSARSFAAPFGQWGSHIADALEHFDFEFSSEFSYDYDNMPSRRSAKLQVPVHPISAGTLRRQGFDPDQMEEYFKDVVDWKHAQREPIILYHHPKNKHLEVFGKVFSRIREKDIPALRMIDYARWWKEREGLATQIDVDRGICSVGSGGNSATHWLHLTRENGTEAFAPIPGSVDMSQLSWNPIPVVPPLPVDVLRIRKFNPWILINRAEDFVFKPFVKRM